MITFVLLEFYFLFYLKLFIHLWRWLGCRSQKTLANAKGLIHILTPWVMVWGMAALRLVNSAPQKHHQEARIFPSLDSAILSLSCPPTVLRWWPHSQASLSHWATCRGGRDSPAHFYWKQGRPSQKTSSGLPLISNCQNSVTGPRANSSLAPGMDHSDWVTPTGIHLLPGRGPWRKGEGGGLHRIRILLGTREQGEVCNNPQLEKMRHHTIILKK